MTAFAYYLVKVILCSGVLFLYYQVALRNRLFHQWNRFYLLASVFLSLCLPLVRFTIFESNAEQISALDLLRSFQYADHRMEAFIVVSNKGLSEEQWLVILYGLVSFFLLGMFSFSLARIWKIIRTYPHQRISNITLIETDVQGTPFTFFCYVFWNKQLSLASATGQQIFQHELVHVKQKHTVDKLLLQVVLLLFWCNPFFWLMRKELNNIHEFIADKKAVGDSNANALATLLLHTAYPTQFSSFTNAFFQTSIKRRLMMLKQKPHLSYAGRLMVLPVVALLSFAFTVRTKAIPAVSDALTFAPANDAVTDTLPQKEIQSVSVNKNGNSGTINITYKDGSSKTYTKEQAVKEGLIKDKQGKETTTTNATAPKPLFMLEGKEFTGDLNSIDPKTIESVNVLKGKTATDKYGQKGENGVVEITLKKKELGKPTAAADPVFSAADVSASIDQQDWKKFLEENTGSLIDEISKEAPAGTYTVNIRFVVNTNGGLSDFEALNDPGYRMAEKVLAMMKSAPKWKPAVQNGRAVSSYHTQPITFVVAEKKATSSNTSG
jgi:hypothetical protein